MHRHLARIARLSSASSRILSSEAQQRVPVIASCPQVTGGIINPGNAAEGQLPNRELISLPRSYSTSAPSEPRAELHVPPQYVGKTVAKLINAPKYVLKYELLAYFEGCDLTPDSISAVIDDRLRMMHWRIVFDSPGAFKRATHILGARKRMASRNLRLEQVDPKDLAAESNPGHPNRVADGFRGKALVMTGLPEEVSTDTIERFFEDYNLAPFAIRYVRIFHEKVRTPLRLRVEGERRQTIDLVERRALVKFMTEQDCFRALRELHKSYLVDRPVDLRVLQ